MTEISAQHVAGKKALVTGAAGGLGAAISRMLARHSARVFLTDLDETAVRAVAASINAEHGAMVAVGRAAERARRGALAGRAGRGRRGDGRAVVPDSPPHRGPGQSGGPSWPALGGELKRKGEAALCCCLAHDLAVPQVRAGCASLYPGPLCSGGRVEEQPAG